MSGSTLPGCRWCGYFVGTQRRRHPVTTPEPPPLPDPSAGARTSTQMPWRARCTCAPVGSVDAVALVAAFADAGNAMTGPPSRMTVPRTRAASLMGTKASAEWRAARSFPSWIGTFHGETSRPPVAPHEPATPTLDRECTQECPVHVVPGGDDPPTRR